MAIDRVPAGEYRRLAADVEHALELVAAGDHLLPVYEATPTAATARRPADDRHLAADRATLAAILDRRGAHAEAERLYRAALAVFARCGAAYEVVFNHMNLGALPRC